MKASDLKEGMHVSVGWWGASKPSTEDAALVGRTGVLWAPSGVRPGDWWVILDDPSSANGQGKTVSVRSRDLSHPASA